MKCIQSQGCNKILRGKGVQQSLRLPSFAIDLQSSLSYEGATAPLQMHGCIPNLRFKVTLSLVTLPDWLLDPPIGL